MNPTAQRQTQLTTGPQATGAMPPATRASAGASAPQPARPGEQRAPCHRPALQALRRRTPRPWALDRSPLDRAKLPRSAATLCAAALWLGTACSATDGGLGKAGPASAGPSGVAGAGGTGIAAGGSGAGSLQNIGTPPPAVDPSAPYQDGSCVKDVDLVFVMDVSLSMGPFFQKLEQEILVVDQAIKNLNPPNPPHYGLVVFVDDIEVTNGGAPYADAVALRDAFVQWHSFVSTDFITGNNQLHNTDPTDKNYSWPENSLDAIYGAATGFQWREASSTLRMIIHTTDDSFWDLKAAASGDPSEPYGSCAPGWQNFPPASNNLCLTTGSAHSYEEVIASLRDSMIWVNNFAALRGGPPDVASATLGVYRGTAVDVSLGFFNPYKGLNSIPVSTGGVAWDIDQVLAGNLSLSQGINDSIVAKQCMVYPPPPPPPQ